MGNLAGRHGWRVWFAGFFLIGLGWSLFTPINQYPDESDHVYRAASVVRGHVWPKIGEYTHGTGALAPVPRAIHEVFTTEPCTGLKSPRCAPTALAIRTPWMRSPAKAGCSRCTTPWSAGLP
ncbi:hypothetical protein Pflav_036220 [Phytohabitans flavus]|uniref:Uncharacterized protein n=1 Tax=Phytohabitans flavus TaxID=1076124 RepID=A0A6F8XTN3_9ACTN|nr:hypothetical protein Pflav_036220 [Phytohabitans flavus]